MALAVQNFNSQTSVDDRCEQKVYKFISDLSGTINTSNMPHLRHEKVKRHMESFSELLNTSGEKKENYIQQLNFIMYKKVSSQLIGNTF